MQPSQACINLISKYEGCKLSAYQCSAGVWTIGYGHTSGVKKGDRLSQANADRLLRSDVEDFAADVGDLLVQRGVTATQNQFDALVCFAFNVGIGALSKSTLLKKLAAGDAMGAADQFRRWNKAGGKELAGLTKRRESERALFLTE